MGIVNLRWVCGGVGDRAPTALRRYSPRRFPAAPRPGCCALGRLRPGRDDSAGEEEAPPQEGETGAAEHRPLDKLQPIDLPLDLTIAVGQSQRRFHSRLVEPNAVGGVIP